MSEIEYDESMLEEYYINRFLNMIAMEYDGGLARQFEKYYLEKCNEITRLENIIKEVREYIKNLREDDEYLEELHFNYEDKYKLLEILDKENNK